MDPAYKELLRVWRAAGIGFEGPRHATDVECVSVSIGLFNALCAKYPEHVRNGEYRLNGGGHLHIGSNSQELEAYEVVFKQPVEVEDVVFDA